MDRTIEIHTWVASRWWQRARGLLGRPLLAPASGMLFPGTASVHGFGMQHALDLVFLDAHDRVLRCCRLPRWGVRLCRGASAVLELRAGEIARLGVRPGQYLRLVPMTDIAQLFAKPSSGHPASGLASHPLRGLALLGSLAAIGLSGWASDALAARPSEAAPSMTIKKYPASQPESRQRKRVGRTITTGRQIRPQGTTVQRHPVGIHGWHVQHAQAQIQLPVAIQAGIGLDAAFLEAERLYRGRQDEEALSLFSSLVALGGQHREQALFRIGNLHQRRGDTGLALDAYWRLMGLVTDDGAAVVPGSSSGPVQREQQARQLKAMINANLLAVEQVRQSLAWIAQLQQDPGVRTAAGLDERMASEISQQLWQHSEEVRRMMEALGAWAPQTHTRPAPPPASPNRLPLRSSASSGPERVTVVYEQPPRRSRKKSVRTPSATLTTSTATAPAASASASAIASASEQVTSSKPEILSGGQRAEKPATAGDTSPKADDASASVQPQPQPQPQQQQQQQQQAPTLTSPAASAQIIDRAGEPVQGLENREEPDHV